MGLFDSLVAALFGGSPQAPETHDAPEPTWCERRDGVHNHPCWRCGSAVRCGGRWERDEDGIYCDVMTDYRGPECQACHETRWCDVCGENEGVVGETDGCLVCPRCVEEL